MKKLENLYWMHFYNLQKRLSFWKMYQAGELYSWLLVPLNGSGEILKWWNFVWTIETKENVMSNINMVFWACKCNFPKLHLVKFLFHLWSWTYIFLLVSHENLTRSCLTLLELDNCWFILLVPCLLTEIVEDLPLKAWFAPRYFIFQWQLIPNYTQKSSTMVKISTYWMSLDVTISNYP